MARARDLDLASPAATQARPVEAGALERAVPPAGLADLGRLAEVTGPDR